MHRAVAGQEQRAAGVQAAESFAAAHAVRVPGQRRVGLIHALTNATGIALTVASFRRRRCAPESSTSSVALSLAGLGMIGVGGVLGGHLAYALGMGVSPRAHTHDTDATGPAYDPVLAEPVTPADR